MSRSNARFVKVRRGRLTRPEKTRIADLADEGMSALEIARKLNRHPNTINFHMVTTGLRAPVERSFAYVRGGVPVLSFTAEEDQFIHVLRIQGFPLKMIANATSKRFGHSRKPNAIGIRLQMLASRETASDL